MNIASISSYSANTLSSFPGGAEAVDMPSRINAIQTNVAAWFTNNGNYDSAMEVIESGNNADIQSLMQCYSAGSTL